MKKTLLNKFITIAALTSLLFVIFVVTNPDDISLSLLLIPYIVIGVLAYKIFNVMLIIFSHDNSNKTKLFSLGACFFVVLILLLESLAQLTLKDGLLVFGFTLFFMIYVYKADFLN